MDHNTDVGNASTLAEETSKVTDHLNDVIIAHTRKLVAQDAVTPLDYSEVDIDKFIAEVHPDLWQAILLLTRSVSDRRGTSKTIDPSSRAYQLKKIRCFFLLCMVVFCTDNRCSFHTLVTDMVDSQGGSDLLIKLLNRFGVCSSVDTLSRFMQYKVKDTSFESNSKHLKPESFICSADNIDFLHSYSTVFKGSQKSSWHGTSIQAVQPLPSLEADIEIPSSLESISFSTASHGDTTTYTSTEENRQQPVVTGFSEVNYRHTMSRKRTERSSPLPSPLKLTSSPMPKILRRLRTGMEQAQAERPISGKDFSKSSNPQINTTVKDKTADFQTNEAECTAFEELQQQVHTYMLLRHSVCSCESENTFLNIQDYLSSIRTTHTEKSNVAYLQVMDAVADSKDTLMQMLNNLHEHYIVKQGKQDLVVEGDAKVYDLLKSLKFEYGSELNWVIPYPGDWHLLKNYQIPLMKAYYDAGLKDLAHTAGYPTASIQACGQFKRTHHFILEVWEAV